MGHTESRRLQMLMWQTIRCSTLARHNHERAYAAIVLAGGYEEAGDQGRLRVEAGNVVLHERFEAHIDRFVCSESIVLNLPLPAWGRFQPGRAFVADLDSILRIAEKDKTAAVTLLLSELRGRTTEYIDWPDELAGDLMKNASLSLSCWGESRGLKPWAVSRGFTQVFGLSPSAFRVRVRTRSAWKAIEGSEAPLAEIAARLGFADQSHMTRCIKQLTGITPLACRSAANRFKTRQHVNR